MYCKNIKNCKKIYIFLLISCVLPPVFAADLPIIVLDPGHGGNDPGATTRNGLKEKNITLNFSKVLKAEIEAEKFAHVVLTRTKDQFVPIEKRVEIAQKYNAKLMISIHADSLAQNPFFNSAKYNKLDASSVRGATFYTLSEIATDNETAQFAARENRADIILDKTNKTEEFTIKFILNDLMARETRLLSHHFVNISIQTLEPIIKFTKIPHRSAKFRVLNSNEIPSVLFEMGYLTSSDDTKLLTSEVWQRAVSQKFIVAIKHFFNHEKLSKQ